MAIEEYGYFHSQSAKRWMVEESVGVCEEAPGNDQDRNDHRVQPGSSLPAGISTGSSPGSKSGSGRMVWISAPDGGNHDSAGPMVQQERLEPKESATNAVTAQVEPNHSQQARR